MLPGAFWGKYDKIGRWDGDIYSTFDSVVYVAGFKHVFFVQILFGMMVPTDIFKRVEATTQHVFVQVIYS